MEIRYNSEITISDAITGTGVIRFNSEINLSGNIFISLPVTCNVKERLKISGAVNILPITSFSNLPFSNAGGSL